MFVGRIDATSLVHHVRGVLEAICASVTIGSLLAAILDDVRQCQSCIWLLGNILLIGRFLTPLGDEILILGIKCLIL